MWWSTFGSNRVNLYSNLFYSYVCKWLIYWKFLAFIFLPEIILLFNQDHSHSIMFVMKDTWANDFSQWMWMINFYKGMSTFQFFFGICTLSLIVLDDLNHIRKNLRPSPPPSPPLIVHTRRYKYPYIFNDCRKARYDTYVCI